MKQSNGFNPLAVLILVGAYIADVAILASYDGDFSVFIFVLWIVVIVPPLIAVFIGIVALHSWLKKRDMAYALSKEGIEPATGQDGPEQGRDSALMRSDALEDPGAGPAVEAARPRPDAFAGPPHTAQTDTPEQGCLYCHTAGAANLNHGADPQFHQLAAQCAAGDAAAMWALGSWFDTWAQNPSAGPFYRRAANYWRVCACRRGHAQAEAWYAAATGSPHGQPPETALFERDDPDGLCRRAIPGKLLGDLGYAFFKPEREYEIRRLEEDGLVEARSFADYQPSEIDGAPGCYYEYLWFLDGNMQPIPGVEGIRCPMNAPDYAPLLRARSMAAEIVGRRSAV